MKKLDEEWRQIDTDDMSPEQVMEFMKQCMQFNVNLNTDDDKTQEWIKNNRVWILPKDHGK